MKFPTKAHYPALSSTNFDTVGFQCMWEIDQRWFKYCNTARETIESFLLGYVGV